MPPSAMLFNEENTCKGFWKEDLTYLRYSVKKGTLSIRNPVFTQQKENWSYVRGLRGQ